MITKTKKEGKTRKARKSRKTKDIYMEVGRPKNAEYILSFKVTSEERNLDNCIEVVWNSFESTIKRFDNIPETLTFIKKLLQIMV